MKQNRLFGSLTSKDIPKKKALHRAPQSPAKNMISIEGDGSNS